MGRSLQWRSYRNGHGVIIYEHCSSVGAGIKGLGWSTHVAIVGVEGMLHRGLASDFIELSSHLLYDDAMQARSPGFLFRSLLRCLVRARRHVGNGVC